MGVAMKTKCMHCETIYEVEDGACPSCGKRGGFMQEPRMKDFPNFSIHIEEVIVHSPTGNEYQVKEIQASGLIAKIMKCPLPVPNKPVYISNTTIDEYKVKR